MSLNLVLSAGRKSIELRQTRTEITEAAMASPDPKAVYFADLELRLDRDSPDHGDDLAILNAHKAEIERFLCANPTAKWSAE